jgi:hypothetical protein
MAYTLACISRSIVAAADLALQRYDQNHVQNLLCGRNVTFSLVHEGGMNELGIDTHQNTCILHCLSLVLQNWASSVWLEAPQNGFRNFLLRHF